MLMLTWALGWLDTPVIVEDHVIGTEAAWHTDSWTEQPVVFTCSGTQRPTL